MATENRFGIGQRIRSLKNSTSANIDVGCQALLAYFVIFNTEVWIRLLRLEFPFLPFIKAIDTIPNTFFCYISIIIFTISFPAIFIGFRQRFFSLILGFDLLLIILSSKPIYSTNLVFASCILILVGLSEGKNWVFRIQIAILYFGAAINKAFSIDWWNGVYFANFSSVFPIPIFEFLANTTDRVLLAQSFSISTIGIEFMLAFLFLFKRTKNKGIILGLFFHGSMYILTKGQLSFVYLYVMCAAYVLSIGTTSGMVHVLCPKKTLFKLLKKIDVLKTINWDFQNTNKICLRYDSKEHESFTAIGHIFLQLRIVPYFLFTGMTLNKILDIAAAII